MEMRGGEEACPKNLLGLAPVLKRDERHADAAELIACKLQLLNGTCGVGDADAYEQSTIRLAAIMFLQPSVFAQSKRLKGDA